MKNARKFKHGAMELKNDMVRQCAGYAAHETVRCVITSRPYGCFDVEFSNGVVWWNCDEESIISMQKQVEATR